MPCSTYSKIHKNANEGWKSWWQVIHLVTTFVFFVNLFICIKEKVYHCTANDFIIDNNGSAKINQQLKKEINSSFQYWLLVDNSTLTMMVIPSNVNWCALNIQHQYFSRLTLSFIEKNGTAEMPGKALWVAAWYWSRSRNTLCCRSSISPLEHHDDRKSVKIHSKATVLNLWHIYFQKEISAYNHTE